jgi:hypothetical protein
MWRLLRKPNPTSYQREGPNSKHVNSPVTNENCVWVPVATKTKNDYAGKGQQKTMVLLCRPVGLKTKNDCAGKGQQQVTDVLRVVTERPLPPFNEEEDLFQNP